MFFDENEQKGFEIGRENLQEINLASYPSNSMHYEYIKNTHNISIETNIAFNVLFYLGNIQVCSAGFIACRIMAGFGRGHKRFRTEPHG